MSVEIEDRRWADLTEPVWYTDNMNIPVGFGQATFTYSGSGVPTGAANTMGFQNVGGATAAELSVALVDLWADEVMPALVQNTGLAGCLVKLGPLSTGPSAFTASTVAGSDLSAQASPNVAYLVRKTTALGGRKNRGRFFLPGVDESEVDQGGNVSPTKLENLNLALSDAFTRMIAEDTPPMLLHNDATAPTAITVFSIDSKVATIRRRLRR